MWSTSPTPLAEALKNHSAEDTYIKALSAVCDTERFKYKDYKPRTQKARGLLYGASVPGTYSVYNDAQVFPKDFPKLYEKTFARPAPMNPRHGFVESRPVSNYKQILDLFHEARKEDPEAEIIIMPQISGKWSAIATNAGVAFGLGNDGVTSGKAALLVPTNGVKDEWNVRVGGYNVAKEVGITDTTYLELVEGNAEISMFNRQLYLVQRRNGPEQSMQLDFIPNDAKVTKIITPSDVDGDLLAWERYVKAQPVKGTVVDLRGGSPTSHYAVHAIERGIAVVCDPKTVIEHGKPLAVTFKRKSLSRQQLRAIARYAKKWLAKKIAYSDGVLDGHIYTSVGVIHSMSTWGAEEHLLELRALGPVLLARFLHAAALGEIRHWDNSGPGRFCEDGEDEEGDPCPGGTSALTKYKSGRSANYNKAFAIHDFATISENLRTLSEDYGTKGWKQSFGGANWQRVTDHTRTLVTALERFIERPTMGKWRKVTMAANTALHTAHNTGLPLSKWVNQSHLTQIACNPSLGFTNLFAGDVVSEHLKGVK